MMMIIIIMLYSCIALHVYFGIGTKVTNFRDAVTILTLLYTIWPFPYMITTIYFITLQLITIVLPPHPETTLPLIQSRIYSRNCQWLPKRGLPNDSQHWAEGICGQRVILPAVNICVICVQSENINHENWHSNGCLYLNLQAQCLCVCVYIYIWKISIGDSLRMLLIHKMQAMKQHEEQMLHYSSWSQYLNLAANQKLEIKCNMNKL